MRLILIVLTAAIAAGCSGPPPAPPTREVILVLPKTGGLPDAQRLEVRSAYLSLVGEQEPPGTWVTAIDSETMNVIGQVQVTGGARSFRLYGPESGGAVRSVLQALEPELAAMAPPVAYQSLPAALLSHRKTDLPLRVVVVGSACPESIGFGPTATPCDREITREDGPFAKRAMGDFPAKTTLAIVPPREDWGPSAAYRLRGVNFLRLLVAARGGELLRITTDVRTAFQATSPQWPDPAKPSDECNEPSEPHETPVLATPVAAAAVPERPPAPDADRLLGPMQNTVLLFDSSGSMGWLDKDVPLVGVTPAAKRHAAGLLQTLPFQRFAIVGFGGTANDTPELKQYPWTLGPYLRDATPESREAGAAFIEALTPSGGTPTLPALRAAASLAGVDTICLYTDGRPSLGGMPDEILDYADELRELGVVVNVIGCGVLARHEADYDAESFLKLLARKTGGEYFLLDTPQALP